MTPKYFLRYQFVTKYLQIFLQNQTVFQFHSMNERLMGAAWHCRSTLLRCRKIRSGRSAGVLSSSKKEQILIEFIFCKLNSLNQPQKPVSSSRQDASKGEIKWGS